MQCSAWHYKIFAQFMNIFLVYEHIDSQCPGFVQNYPGHIKDIHLRMEYREQHLIQKQTNESKQRVYVDELRILKLDFEEHQ